MSNQSARTSQRQQPFRSNTSQQIRVHPKDQTKVILEYHGKVQSEFNAPRNEGSAHRSEMQEQPVIADAISLAQEKQLHDQDQQRARYEKLRRFQETVQSRVQETMIEKELFQQKKRTVVNEFLEDARDTSKQPPAALTPDELLNTKEVKRLNHVILRSTMERQRQHAKQWQENKKRIEEEKKILYQQHLFAENERLQREQQIKQQMEAENAKQEKLVREEDDHIQRVRSQLENRERKLREEARYMDALRKRLQIAMDREGITIPHICPCGYPPLENLGQLCAVNCPFYNNPEAVAKLLQGLLMRLGVDDR